MRSLHMEKELQRFLNGEANYYRGEMTVTRERVGESTHYEISIDGKMFTQFWGKPGELPKPNEKKKSVGGKKPYVMLMTSKLEELMKSGKTNVDINGYLFSLTPYIEWNTGKIINKRSKKPLNESDICKMFNISEKTWRRKFKQLKENELIASRDGGFYISTDLFKKGGVKKNENSKIGKQEDQKEKRGADSETSEKVRK